MRPICKTILVVDDLANRHHECDILVDQNLGREEIDYKGLVPETCRVLTGSDYALLRPEFSEMRERSLARRKKNQLRQVIIAMGGVDQTDKTSRVLRALSQCTGLAGLHITVVLGSTAPHQQNVQREVENLPCSANLQVGVSDMAQLMSKSDLAVGAPGTSSWERACLGLPAILMIVAENQRAIAKSLQTFGAAIIVDDDDGLTNSLQQNLNLLTKVNTLAAMSEAASKITDGRGVERVVHELL